METDSHVARVQTEIIDQSGFACVRSHPSASGDFVPVPLFPNLIFLLGNFRGPHPRIHQFHC